MGGHGVYEAGKTGRDEIRGGNKNVNPSISFDTIIRQAIRIGLHPQSEQFLELRPDIFLMMCEEYERKHQEELGLWRTLFQMQSGIDMREAMPLPLLDGQREKQANSVLTKEEIEAIRERDRKILEKRNGTNSINS